MLNKVFHPQAAVDFLLGLGRVGWQELLHRTRGTVTARTVVFLWVGSTTVFLALLTPTNWSRYFVPLVPCQAVILGYLASVVRRRRNARCWRPLGLRGQQDGREHSRRSRVEPVSAPSRQGGKPKNPRPHSLRDRPDRNQPLVVIPAHNEGDTVDGVIAGVRTHVPSADILVIDDGSTDNTATVARDAGALAISLPQNLGIGAATQTGYIFAHEMGYHVVVRVDADGQHDPAEIPRLISALWEEGVHVVVGSRFLEGGAHATPFVRRLGIWVLANLISLITSQEVTDPTSGFHVVDREALALYASYFPHDYPEPESRVLLHHAGFKVKEIPVSMGRRRGGRSSIGAFDSIYYMVRVTIALLIDLLRAAPQGRKHHGKG
jgi:hypothetical protein